MSVPAAPNPIRIHFAYRHVERPWGGANNFIRALHADMLASDRFTFTPEFDDECDILFMNELGRGPAQNSETWSLSDVKRRLSSAGRRRPRLVVRAVNLRRHAFASGPRNLIIGRWQDRKTIGLLNLADFVIFQSQYQREFFVEAGYRGSRDTVIHNGASTQFWVPAPVCPPLDGNLALISSTASPRATKRHELIARMSNVPGVTVTHLGAWPAGLDSGAVKRLDVRSHAEMPALLADAHYLLHTAVKDPCPNSVFEAICAGLPVIYNPGPGSSAEIVGPCGLALEESDLGGTAELARRSLPALRAKVLEHRARYRIERAAADYRGVFESMAGDGDVQA